MIMKKRKLEWNEKTTGFIIDSVIARGGKVTAHQLKNVAREALGEEPSSGYVETLKNKIKEFFPKVKFSSEGNRSGKLYTITRQAAHQPAIEETKTKTFVSVREHIDALSNAELLLARVQIILMAGKYELYQVQRILSENTLNSFEISGSKLETLLKREGEANGIILIENGRSLMLSKTFNTDEVQIPEISSIWHVPEGDLQFIEDLSKTGIFTVTPLFEGSKGFYRISYRDLLINEDTLVDQLIITRSSFNGSDNGLFPVSDRKYYEKIKSSFLKARARRGNWRLYESMNQKSSIDTELADFFIRRGEMELMKK